MKKAKINFLDFEIDRLTRSIENVATGDSFPTDVSHLVKAELKQVSKKNNWVFNWKSELDFPDREVLQTDNSRQPKCYSRFSKFEY